jgi:hypothetical protein
MIDGLPNFKSARPRKAPRHDIAANLPLVDPEAAVGSRGRFKPEDVEPICSEHATAILEHRAPQINPMARLQHRVGWL